MRIKLTLKFQKNRNMTRFFLPFTLNSLILRSERVIQNLMEPMIHSHQYGRV